MSRDFPRAIAFYLVVVGVVALVAALGCQEATTPPPDVPVPGEIVFTPAEDQLEVVWGETLSLSARAIGVDTFETEFRHGDAVIATQPDLRYAATAVGEDSILATVSSGDLSEDHLWRLHVVGTGTEKPPLPRDFQVIITDQVYISWTGEPGYGGPVALSRYELRCLPREYVNEANWNRAYSLGVIEFDPQQPTYLVVKSVEPPALPIDTPVGFGLRLVDVDGASSPLALDDVFIPPGYIVEGTVTDIDGRSLANVEVRWTYCDGRTYTDANGRYRSYLLPRHELVGIHYSDDGVDNPGIGLYYDVVIQWQVESEYLQNIMLMPVATIDTTCGSDRYDNDFLSYFRDLTYTDPALYPRQEYITNRWPNPPITVHVIDRLNDNGTFSLGALADSAITIWNQRLGDPFFIPATDPDSAQLTVFFDDDGLAGNIAITRIIDPYLVDINAVAPRKMSIQARTGFPQSTYALEVLLHEFGHTFCISGHSRCDAGVHLMSSNPAGIIAARWPESPIHDDEVRLIRTMYSLPPDFRFDFYRVD